MWPCALDFLHGKAKISHNNVSEECVYVSTVDSQWKLGGLETARHFKKIDTSVSWRKGSFKSTANAVKHKCRLSSPCELSHYSLFA